LTEYELIVDSSEQPGKRPGEYKQQQKYYSGKKKTHTFKNQITVLPDGQDIVDVIAGPRTKSDITLFREGQKTLTLIKSFKVIKVIKENHQLRLPQKAEERRINS